MAKTKIALVQQPAGEDKSENLRLGLEAVRQAAIDGAQVVAFAELAFERFYPQKPAGPNVRDLAETIPGPITDAFCELARECGIVVVLNLFEIDGDKTYDSSPVINTDGSIMGVTRMIHITEYPCFHEQSYYAPGDRGIPVYETEFGTIGVAICYDRHYPEYMRALAVAGAEIVFIPQAGTVGEWPEGLYEAELRVAAFQNGYFAALCNRVGVEDEMEFAGESFICDPAGVVVSRAGQGTTETLHAELDLDLVKNSHAQRLFLRDRRPELYAQWIGSE